MGHWWAEIARSLPGRTGEKPLEFNIEKRHRDTGSTANHLVEYTLKKLMDMQPEAAKCPEAIEAGGELAEDQEEEERDGAQQDDSDMGQENKAWPA